MDAFFSFLKFIAVIIGVLIVIFLVLLSLPNSKLRQSVMKIYSIISLVATIFSALYIISPIDAIPDFIPVAGQSDDLVALITAIATASTSYFSWQASKKRAKEPKE